MVRRIEGVDAKLAQEFRKDRANVRKGYHY